MRHHREQAVLIVAASGRALAVSARRGGFAPLVVDWFGDQDTLAAAAAHRRLDNGLARGMEPDAVLAALDSLARGRDPAGVVCGTGFEDRPDLLARIARRWPLIGNSAETVARVKDPVALAALARACGVRHPAIAWERPGDPAGWLVKRRGGAGGNHIAGASSGAAGRDRYFQRRVAGTPVSALILGDGRQAVVLGLSEQWCAPAANRPFRYGGAVTPASIAPRTAAALAGSVQRLAAAVPLTGLNSIDFMVDGDDAWLVDINPRPGATLDIFAPDAGSLFARHVAACGGTLEHDRETWAPVFAKDHAPANRPARDESERSHHALAPPQPAAGARAAAIVYADRDIARVPQLDWPDWSADRPQAGTAIRADDPLCTVRAEAPTAAAAKRLLARRAGLVQSLLQARAA